MAGFGIPHFLMWPSPHRACSLSFLLSSGAGSVPQAHLVLHKLASSVSVETNVVPIFFVFVLLCTN